MDASLGKELSTDQSSPRASIDRRGAFAIIGGHAVALVALAWVLVTLRLPHQIFIVTIVPILFVAFSYPRWVYLTMLLTLIAPALWVTWSLSSQFASSLVTLGIEFPTLILIAELINQMSARQAKIERQLREQEAHYRVLVENQGEGVAVADLQENLTFVNPAAEQIFGVPPGELLGKNLRAFTTPAQFARLQEQTKQRRAGEKSSYEFEIVRPDGETRTLLLTGTPHFDTRGQLLSTFGVFRDITERKRAEQVLARRDAILNAATLAAERFLRTSAWQDHIRQVMEHLGEATQMSRIYIFENHWEPDGTLQWHQRFEWVAPYVAPQINQIEVRQIQPLESGFARWVKTLEQGKWIQGNVKDFPPDEQTPLMAQKVRSTVVVPVFVQTTWWGIFSITWGNLFAIVNPT
ncbi:MAG: PAS domain S-box protein [Chloroflexi bacterium]|nr:PAS domain S-box protein [Chloroflexota bacterium]